MVEKYNLNKAEIDYNKFPIILELIPIIINRLPVCFKKVKMKKTRARIVVKPVTLIYHCNLSCGGNRSIAIADSN